MPVQHRTKRTTPARRRRLFLESLERRCVLAGALFGVPIGQGNFIVEINPVSGAEIRRIATPAPIAAGPDGLAYNGESLFFLAGGGTLYEINAVSGAVVDSDSLSGVGTGSFDGLGFLNGKLYLQEHGPSQVRVYDPVNDVATGTPFPIPGGIVGGLTGVSNPDELVATLSATGAVRINPTTGAVLGTFNLGGPTYWGVASLNNQLYFGSSSTNHIRVTDRAGTLISTITTPYAFSALASDDTRIERVSNGGFEFGPAGWTIFNQPGSSGSGFQPYTGAPVGSPLPPPPEGSFAAMNQHTGAGTYILYRDFVLPAGQSHSLSLIAYYQNQFTNFVTPATLDYQGAANQQFRIDIITLPANLLSVAAGDVLQNVFRTNLGDPLTLAPTTITADLTPFAGQTVRLRIAVVNNQHFLHGAVDAVSLISNTMPTTPPPATTRIYVGEQDPVDGIGGRVEVFDESLALLSTIDDPIFDTGTLTDVEVGPTGDVFVSLEVNPTTAGRIVRFTSAGAFVSTITMPNDLGGQPLSVLGFDVADDGTFWVAHVGKSNRVFHISATGTLLGETSVPAQSPHDVTVNAAGLVYASNGSQGEAHVNLRADGNRWQARFGPGDALLLSPSNVILATRTIGGQPIDAQEASSGNLYVTRIGTTAGLNKLDAAGAPAGTANTAERAFGLAVSTVTTTPPAVTRIYVAETDPIDNIGGRVEVFDENLALVATIDDPIFDTGTLGDVEVGPTGDVFVSIELNPSTSGKIARFTSAGAFVSFISMPNDLGGQPLSIVGFDIVDDGTFWVAHPLKPGRVFHVSAAGALLGETSVPSSSPLDVAVSSGGLVYASNTNNGESQLSIRADGNRWQARSGPGDAQLLSPAGTVLATRTPGGPLVDAQEADSGNLYISRYATTGSLLKFTAAGVAAGTANTVERAVGLAVSATTTTPPTGSTVPRIYVSEREPDSIGGRIEVYDRTLTLVQTIDHPIFDTGTLTDIEIGPSGNVFIGIDTTGSGLGSGGRLLEFTPAGTFVGAIDLPNDASGPYFYPLGFVVAADGSFRVAVPNTPNAVFHVSPTGALLGTINVPAVRVIDVAIGAGSTVYATDLNQGDGGISARADGNLWVGRSPGNDLQLRTTAGTLLATRTFGPNNSDLQEAADGNLYAVRFDVSGALRRFDAVGNVINTINLPEIGAGIAIANLPTTFQVSSFAATSTGAVLDFSGDLDPSTLNLYNTQGDGLGPADLVLQGASVGSIRGSMVVDPSLRRLTFIATSGRLPPDTYTLTLRSAADGVRDATQILLDGDSNGTAGGDFVRTFVVTPSTLSLVSVGLPNFARGPQQNVNSPASVNSGIPISFNDGGGITSANFQIRYSPALLTISQALVAPGIPNASVNINLSTPGLAIIQFSTGTPLNSGTTRFVDILASVPTSATYRSKHVLDITNVVLNGGSVPAIDDDAIHIAAYFGDATGNGLFSATDAGRISRVAVGFDTGFQLYRLLDPMIMGDITGAGGISSTDASRMLQASVGFPIADIPPLPLPAVSLTQGGPDPKLSIPTDLVATAGSELIVPVNIDSIVDLTGTGLDSADLVLYYDPAVLDVTRVSLGSLIADRGGWIIASQIDSLAGRIFVSLTGNVPLEGFFQGEFVQLHATVKANAPAGSMAINLAASARDIAIYTQLNEGFLTLIPAPTDAADDPSVDGLVTILASPSTTSGAIVPAVRIVDERLFITGSDSDERIFVGPWGLDQVRVRVGNRLLGTFDIPAGIAIDGGGGRDVIVASPQLPATVIAADLIVKTNDDLVLAGDSAQRQELLRGSDSVHELALLQLVADWSDRWEAASNSSPARPQRWRRF